MEDMYSVLVSMDYPDAITGNLRRSTDVARSIMERTRGDLTLSFVQRRLAPRFPTDGSDWKSGAWICAIATCDPSNPGSVMGADPEPS